MNENTCKFNKRLSKLFLHLKDTKNISVIISADYKYKKFRNNKILVLENIVIKIRRTIIHSSCMI